MLPIDLHTHTTASGHGTTDTIADLAKSACQKGMLLLGISDHGPATPGSCRESYFRGLPMAPKKRAGIALLYGAEANILNPDGQLDLRDDILAGLDFCIASIHPQTYRSPAYHRTSFWNNRQTTETPELAKTTNTNAYIHAMENPHVNILGHPDDQHYPINCECLVEAAVQNHVYLEVNEASLAPGGYRGETRSTMLKLLRLSLRYRHPILLSSDSHGARDVGSAPLAEALAAEAAYPRELILNYMTLDQLSGYLKRS